MTILISLNDARKKLNELEGSAEYTKGVTDAFNALFDLPTIEAEPRWIPCSERLPEEDTDVLICYRYKQDEGDTSNIKIDITSYGTVCLGGRAIQFLKEWREPFAFFHLNYEVIAWMPLPEPYKMNE